MGYEGLTEPRRTPHAVPPASPTRVPTARTGAGVGGGPEFTGARPLRGLCLQRWRCRHFSPTAFLTTSVLLPPAGLAFPKPRHLLFTVEWPVRILPTTGARHFTASHPLHLVNICPAQNPVSIFVGEDQQKSLLLQETSEPAPGRISCCIDMCCV